MNYLSLENVSKHYGEKVLFDNIELQVSKGQKMALVAKNGSGKSTLLRVIMGMEPPEGETAKVEIHRSVKLGFLPQDPEFQPHSTILDAVFNSDNEMIKAIQAYEQALLEPERTNQMQQAVARMDQLQAWDFEAKIKELLTRFRIDDYQRTVHTLSGGQRKRLALVKLIIDEPDFLILDEPTNHLDLDMIEWLEEYLQIPNRTLLMVTHDRYFLDRVCNNIVELDNGKLYRYSGNYAAFLTKKANRYETEKSELGKDRKLLKKELEWVNRMPKARGTKAKSRVDAFHELKDKVGRARVEEEIQIDIKGQRLGKKILELHNVSKQFGDKILVKGFHYKFKKKERVGIVGPNGVGKTTFLKLLTQEIRTDSGKVVIGGNTVFGHYTQDGIQLEEDKRIIDVITNIAEYIPMEKGQKLTAAQVLERFMFSRKQQQVYVSQLSGGERRRLHLLTVLMKNPNFLILDEPTNDLDIITLNVLEEFLLEFPGCVLIVTHDRYFMDKLVEHLFVFEGQGGIRDFNGNYSEYRAIQKEEEREKKRLERQAEQAEKQKQSNKPEASSSGLSHEQRKEIRRLEKEISKLEEEKSAISKSFDNPDLSPDRIKELSIQLRAIEDKIEEREMRWMELADLA